MKTLVMAGLLLIGITGPGEAVRGETEMPRSCVFTNAFMVSGGHGAGCMDFLGKGWNALSVAYFCASMTELRFGGVTYPAPVEGPGVPSPNPSVFADSCSNIEIAGVKDAGIDQYDGVCLFTGEGDQVVESRGQGMSAAICTMVGGSSYRSRPESGTWRP